MLASPNLSHRRVVIAGRHTHEPGPAYVQGVVSRYAAAQGTTATWRTQDGYPVAPWPNPDPTERVIARVGPQHFTISRPQDLERILSIAQARAENDEDEVDLEDASGPDALLSMSAGEALSLEVEGAQRFARGNITHVPERFRIAVRPTEDGRVAISGNAFFEDAETAAQARAFWEQRRQQASGGLVGFTIYGRVLRSLRIAPNVGRRLPFGVTLTENRTRTLLNAITQFAIGNARARQRARERREARENMRATPMSSEPASAMQPTVDRPPSMQSVPESPTTP